jgi:hypothetical protein
MFCPKCGAENPDRTRYCRSCRHELSAHRLVLEGKVDDAGTDLRAGSRLISIGLVALAILKLNLIMNIIFGPSVFSVTFMATAFLLVALPVTIAGVVRIRRAKRALQQPEEGTSIASSVTAELDAAPPSVTEHTTLELREPEPAAKPDGRRVSQ